MSAVKVPSSEAEIGAEERPRKVNPLLGQFRRLFRIHLARFGIIVLVILALCAIFAPWLAPHEPNITYPGRSLESSSWEFPLGTDQLGRCQLSRILYGSRVSFIVSFGAIGLGVVLGASLGMLAAYARGWVDDVISRVLDAVVAFPSIILAIALVGAMGASLLNVIIAIGIANMPFIARVVRSQALSVRERDYITAAQIMGASGLRTIAHHIWPNCTAPVIVQGTLGMAYAVLTEAALSFLGVGVPPPAATWGGMLQFAFPLLRVAPMLCVIPGLFIFVMVLSINFVGDALRDVLDPRLRGLIR